MINQILDKRYRIVKVLGMGISGPVCLAVDTQDPDYPVCVVRQVRLPSRGNGTLSRIQFLLNTKTEALEKLAETQGSPAVLDFFLESQTFYLIEEFLPGHPAVAQNNNEQVPEEDQGMQRLQEMLSMVEPIAPNDHHSERNKYHSTPKVDRSESATVLEDSSIADTLDTTGDLTEDPDEEVEPELSSSTEEPAEKRFFFRGNFQRHKMFLPVIGVGVVLLAVVGGLLLWRYQDYNNKNTAQSLYNQGIQSMEGGNLPAAIQALSQSLQLNPQNVAAYGNRGNAFYDMGDYAAALADYTKVIEMQPDNLNAYYNRGLVYFDQGNYQGAVADLTIALKVQEHDADVLYKRGVAYYHLKNFPAALADLDRLVRLNPKNDKAWAARGLVKVGLNDPQGAMADYTEAINTNKDGKTFYNRARLRASLGDNAGALQDYNQSIALNPQDADARANRCSTNLSLANFSEAVSDCTEAIRLQPNNAVAFNNRCVANFNRKDHQNALKDCTQAIRLNANNDGAYSNRGDVRRDLGDRTGALEDYSEAIKINPSNNFTYTSRGNVRRDLEDFRGAVEDYSRAISLNPTNGLALYGRGLAYSRLPGSKEQAIDDLQKAAKIFLDNGRVAAYQDAVAQMNKLK